MDKKMIERAVEAAARCAYEREIRARQPHQPVYDLLFDGEKDHWTEQVRDIVTAVLDEVEGAIVAERLNKLVGQLTAERDYYRSLLDNHGQCICDKNPATTDGPQEFCPWHGRSYTDILEWGEEQAERAARVEGLCLAPVPRQDDPHRRAACLLLEGHTTAHSKPHAEVLDSLHRAQEERDLHDEWVNNLAEQMPPEYDGDEAQEALIERYIGDLVSERDALADRAARAEELAESWKYDGRFGYDDGSHACGPDPEGIVLDTAAHELIKALRGESE